MAQISSVIFDETDGDFLVSPDIETFTQRQQRRRLERDWQDAKIRYISSHLSDEALLIQLAEEAAELSKAATKLARYLRGENPLDPKWTREKLEAQVVEELTDVWVASEPLHCAYVDGGIADQKLDRWLSRIAWRSDEVLQQMKDQLLHGEGDSE